MELLRLYFEKEGGRELLRLYMEYPSSKFQVVLVTVIWDGLVASCLLGECALLSFLLSPPLCWPR